MRLDWHDACLSYGVVVVVVGEVVVFVVSVVEPGGAWWLVVVERCRAHLPIQSPLRAWRTKEKKGNFSRYVAQN